MDWTDLRTFRRREYTSTSWHQLRPEDKPKPLDVTLVRIGALRTIMAGLAWFERDSVSSQVLRPPRAVASSWVAGLAIVPPTKKAQKVLVTHRDGLPDRLIGPNVGLSKNTVMEIVRRGAKV
jgi:hypothetical protein